MPAAIKRQNVSDAPTDTEAATPAETPAVTLGGDGESPLPEKQQRVGRPAAITPAATENDPWQMDRLMYLCIHNIDAFAEHELAVYPVGRNMEQLIPSWLAHSVSKLTDKELLTAQNNTATVRKEYFASQLVKPREDELLVDFLQYVKRINEGERRGAN